ncbi:OmpA family protein [Marinicellulosiphila megalodicopiae]|uniref:OmpA family protein n=1 Tax=Marinicellulosiphila megalodicopiae TaxID=2724896 RepID=UPI003BAE5506
MSLLPQVKTQPEDSHWLSLSDLMAGLMMVFLLISVLMMRSVMLEREKIKTIAVSYHETQLAIYQALIDEFEYDLNRFGVNIDQQSLTVVFTRDDAMFETGKDIISDDYKMILAEFFPRYLSVILHFKDSIEEVRLEGHTNSQWAGSLNENDAYFKNLELSQDRTRSVLSFLYSLEQTMVQQNWIKSHLAAVGYSSSKAIINDNVEDRLQSKRVVFRIISDSQLKIRSILEQ